MCGDGAYPVAGVAFDRHGNLFGTTLGAAYNNQQFCSTDADGTVFELTPPAKGGTAWTAQTLHQFSGADGALPMAGVLVDASGALFGTTSSGGTDPDNLQGGGTVFALKPPATGQTAWSLATLYKFRDGNDGANPAAGVIPDATGKLLYGTTPYDGTGGVGTVFQLPK
jgi:hypothetical protein